MSGFDNEMTGVLGRNDRKEKDTHPDFKGNATINGVEYWIDAWTKERKDGSGRKFFSLRFKPKNGAAAAPIQGDDVPF